MSPVALVRPKNELSVLTATAAAADFQSPISAIALSSMLAATCAFGSVPIGKKQQQNALRLIEVDDSTTR